MQAKTTSAIFLALLPLLVSAVPLANMAPTNHVYPGTCHKSANGKSVCRPKDPQVLSVSGTTRIGMPLPRRRSDPVCRDPCPEGADCIVRKSTGLRPGLMCAGLNCPNGITTSFTCKSKPEDVQQAQTKVENKQPPAEKATPAKTEGGQEGQKTGEAPAAQTTK
ncbi:hypothetical protein MAPG_01864 [Magnaporthiopsis poae ATCC 64411]|uniref:Uncharacterized protein n=1 Tax=Magnaporthiopsis poae (strain ATCC 64411 / 73-15) TaxID=644358 RepID=A0A0C4DPU1_MAGP6|nr:hypothetical protein MAPG_01864 [Magnaporthiopsis poae ATCC 64411]